MTTQPASERRPTAGELAEVLDALRAVMADERRAIARLDLESLESITARKHGIVEALTRLHATGVKPSAEEAQAIATTRVDLAASSSLIGTAVAAVAAVLGFEPDDRYDRLARRHVRTRPLRVVAY